MFVNKNLMNIEQSLARLMPAHKTKGESRILEANVPRLNAMFFNSGVQPNRPNPICHPLCFLSGDAMQRNYHPTWE
jgi:hypothetical protein